MWSTCNFCDVYVSGIQIGEAMNFRFCTHIYFVAFQSRLERIKWRQANTELFGKGNINVLTMFGDTIDFLHEITEGRIREDREKNSNATLFSKWWWLCWIKTGSWGRSRMMIQRKDVKNLFYSRRLVYWWWWWWWWWLYTWHWFKYLPPSRHGLPHVTFL